MAIDNGKVSTVLISVVAAVAAAVIANPSILQNVMGNYYAQFGGSVLIILAAIYNVFYPRVQGA